MGLGRSCSFIFIWLFLYLYFSLVHGFNGSLSESLDAIVREHGFKTLFNGRSQTGALYNASLPDNLAGMKISAVRLRSRTLWRIGANFSSFRIPPKTLPVPSVRRLLIVYHDLGNWSSYYCNVSGYNLLTSVIGFMIYDMSNLSDKNLIKLDLNTMGKPIVIQFHNLTSPRGNSVRAKCAAFGTDGRVFLSDMNMPNVCYSRSQGHFSIMSPLKKQPKIWDFWVIGFVLGVVGLILVGLVGTILFRVRTVKRTHEMERVADEGEVLQTFWVDSSKLPRATVTRTHPILENSGFP